VVQERKARLDKLAAATFKPQEVAYVEEPLGFDAPCRGVAEITEEISTRINISLNMQTAGLVVLADRWDAGWRAYLNGRRVPIWRTNHALRGVVAQAGHATLEFRYEPQSFVWGMRLAGFAAIMMIGWVGATGWQMRSKLLT